MKCQLCGQHPASVQYTELSGNAAVEYHICQSCAQSKGLFKSSTGEFSLKSGEFLAGMAGSGEEGGSEPDVNCTSCGKTYAEFRETGRLGCGECYEAFGALLRPILRRVHGSTSHVGKAPAERAGERRPAVELVRLRDELRRALEREDFERCAELRDLIRQTERGTRPT
jgi:protein arginine kinase activator